MKKNLLLLSFLTCVLLRSNAQSVAQTRCDNLGQGVNLSNWLEGYWETDWPDSTVYHEQFLMDMKSAGIKSFRMPVCFALVTDTLPPYSVDTTSRVFRLIDSVITWTQDLDMNLIIDNHDLWNLSNISWRNTEPRLAHLWSVLAQRYSHLDPNRYFFEILNEPSNISDDSVNALFVPVIDTIRQYAPFHSIVVSPSDWSNGIAYVGYQPLSDTNLLYTFHCYDPFNFTHQGLSFVVPPLPTGLPYPNSGYDVALTIAWQASMQWKDSFHLPVFLGEFGVGIGADAQSRCNWMDTMSAHIEATHLSAFHWDVTTDFRLFYSGVTTQDSVIPCFEEALHLYGDTITSVHNTIPNAPVQVFPNPASAWITCVSSPDQPTELEIYESQGRKIFETKFLNRYTVPSGDWAKGMYIVKIQTEQGVRMSKVLIQ